MSQFGKFFQSKAQIGNPYHSDAFLQRLLQRLLPANVFSTVDKDLQRFGSRVQNEIETLGLECEMNPPQLFQYDAWGNRVDVVVTCDAWKKQKDISAEEGIVAIGYERPFQEFSRIYQFAKLFLYSPSSGVYSCPLAMTDGAAKTISALKLTQHEDIYRKLITRDPKDFWTSGQWMTEKKGGSDVANGTETKAVKQINGKYKLYGYKWFSSATDADIALTLARIENPDGSVTEGGEGLSMFLVKTRKQDGSGDLNNINIVKLKNKLGTRGLPTAELILDGTEADLVSPPGRGVACISHMLTITRMYNTLGSAVAMRRVVLLARDYSKSRECFGQPIADYPLHMNTIAYLDLQARGATAIVFEMARLLGKLECNSASQEEEQFLRILTPVAKLYTAKKCVEVASEGLECFGGQGYIEDTGLPAILRNAQVTPIWEGTTNILAMDMLRCLAKSKGEILVHYENMIRSRLQPVLSKRGELTEHGDLINAVKHLEAELAYLIQIFREDNIPQTISRARILAFSLAEIAIGCLLCEHAVSTVGTKADAIAAVRWIAQMQNLENKIKIHRQCNEPGSSEMVYDGYEAQMKSKL